MIAANAHLAHRVGRDTVRRRLRAAGVWCRRPAVRPELLPRHRQARLRWAQNHANWLRQQWSAILFSDESRFLLQRRNDGRMRIYRRRGERFANCCVRQAEQYGHGSVMMWGGITSDFRTQLVRIRGNLTAQRYINEVITPHVVPVCRQHHLTLMQDNAPAHRAHVTHAALAQANIPVLHPWPAISPDLNPVEHLWDVIDRRVRNLPANQQPVTLDQLEQALVAAWRAVPQAVVRRLVHSMRQRCLAVVAARGAHTRY